ncbi:MAG: hypothetical protein KDA75_19010, partial [Planctomycetaceae bacterium]|nr:hypothetical protein [Planctomycetaceae bacterium]
KRKGDNQYPKTEGESIDTPPDCGVSLSEAADALNVGRASVSRARKVKDKGCDELQQAVIAGDVSVSRAAKIADLPKEEQPAAMNEPRAAVEEKIQASKERSSKGWNNLPSIALDLSRQAINILHGFPPDDPRRKEALEKVSGWISTNLGDDRGGASAPAVAPDDGPTMSRFDCDNSPSVAMDVKTSVISAITGIDDQDPRLLEALQGIVDFITLNYSVRT